MAEPDKRPVTLEELLVSSLAQVDALAKLLIEKELITREEFMYVLPRFRNKTSTGSATNNAVLYTATTAARIYRYNIVIPMDGVNAATRYEQEYAIHQFTVLPSHANKSRSQKRRWRDDCRSLISTGSDGLPTWVLTESDSARCRGPAERGGAR